MLAVTLVIAEKCAFIIFYTLEARPSKCRWARGNLPFPLLSLKH